jgi:3-isopropylmalate/(R)-2-methylmalate dehydratase large subunit
MKRKKLAPHARMITNPGSNDVFRQSMREGLIDIFIDAGAMIGTTGCGPCGGCQVGMMGTGENAITSSSRNFRGRMGSQDSNIYVASPASVAAAAIAGAIVHPETVAGEMASS